MTAPGRIVVAEDEDADVQLMKRALARAQVQAPVQFARNGLEAIHLLERDSPEPVLLLLDLRMPLADGFEVLEWLMHHPQRPHVSVIVLSSSGQSEDICRAAELGAVCYIVKPNDPQELVRAMERAQELWRERLDSTERTTTYRTGTDGYPQVIKESTVLKFSR